MREANEQGFEGESYDDAYNRIFGRDDVADPAIKVTVPKPTETPAPPKPVVPDARPSQARLGNDFEQARRTVDITRANQAKFRNAVDESGTRLPYVERQARMMQSIKDDLASLKEQSIRDGEYPTVRLGENNYSIHAADVMESLGKKAEDYHLSDYNRVPTSSLLQGAAKAIETKVGKLDPDTALQVIAEQVRKANKTSKPTSVSRSLRLAQDLLDASDDLVVRMTDNEARMGQKDLIQGSVLGDDVAKQTADAINDPMSGSAQTINAAADVNGKVSRGAKEAGLSAGGTLKGAKQADEKLKQSQTLRDGDTRSARSTEAEAKASRDQKIDKVNKRKQKELDQIEKDLYKDNGDDSSIWQSQ